MEEFKCKYCQEYFEDTRKISKLSSKWGHSLCENCILILTKDNQTFCSDEETINEFFILDNFPKKLTSTEQNSTNNDLNFKRYILF